MTLEEHRLGGLIACFSSFFKGGSKNPQNTLLLRQKSTIFPLSRPLSPFFLTRQKTYEHPASYCQLEPPPPSTKKRSQVRHPAAAYVASTSKTTIISKRQGNAPTRRHACTSNTRRCRHTHSGTSHSPSKLVGTCMTSSTVNSYSLAMLCRKRSKFQHESNGHWRLIRSLPRQPCRGESPDPIRT